MMLVPADTLTGAKALVISRLVDIGGGDDLKAGAMKVGLSSLANTIFCSGDSEKVEAASSKSTNPDAACAESHSRA
jgi:hypothetical protein